MVSESRSNSRIPFEHEDIRAYVDTLFLEGALTPIVAAGLSAVPSWAHVGIQQDPQGDAVRRYHGLKQTFETSIPAVDASHKNGNKPGNVGPSWWCCVGNGIRALNEADRLSWAILHATVENQFGSWMMQRYGSLHNLPFSNRQ